MTRKLLAAALGAVLGASTGIVVTTVAATVAQATTRPTPRLTVGDVSVAEGDAGSIVVQLPIDLSTAAPVKTPVRWTVTGGTATPNSDFAAATKAQRQGTVTIPAGKLTASVKITVLSDTTPEPDETVFLDVTSAPGTTLMRTRGTLTIRNDDIAGSTTSASGARVAVHALAPIPQVIVGLPTLFEGDASYRNAIVPIALSEPAGSPVKVRFSTPGTATTTPRNASRPRSSR